MQRILGNVAPDRASRTEANLARLTPRELAVLRALCNGLTSSQVADEFRVSRRTIESHRSSVLAKLGAKNIVQVISEIAVANWRQTERPSSD